MPRRRHGLNALGILARLKEQEERSQAAAAEAAAAAPSHEAAQAAEAAAAGAAAAGGVWGRRPHIAPDGEGGRPAPAVGRVSPAAALPSAPAPAPAPADPVTPPRLGERRGGGDLAIETAPGGGGGGGGGASMSALLGPRMSWGDLADDPPSPRDGGGDAAPASLIARLSSPVRGRKLTPEEARRRTEERLATAGRKREASREESQRRLRDAANHVREVTTTRAAASEDGARELEGRLQVTACVARVPCRHPPSPPPPRPRARRPRRRVTRGTSRPCA